MAANLHVLAADGTEVQLARRWQAEPVFQCLHETFARLGEIAIELTARETDVASDGIVPFALDVYSA